MLLLIILALAVIAAAVILYGKSRWDAATDALVARIEAARVPIAPTVFHAGELEGLPAPVQRYFRAVLQEGQRIVSAVSVEHSGTFNMSDTGERWRRFTSSQRVITRRPGFVWDARVMMMPGLAVRVHDAFVAGEGFLQASLFGLIPVVDLRGTRTIAEGELMRFFAEAVWYPTALLPSQGVRWEPVDEGSAKATLQDGDIAITMLFVFNEDHLVESTRVEARGRTVNGRVIPTPWQGRVWDYRLRDGMRVPHAGEVAWLLPEGPRPYWRGHIDALVYEFAH